MTYDELRGYLMYYEQNHIHRYNKENKRKTWHSHLKVDIRKEVDENQDEGMTLINRGVRHMLRQTKQKPQ